jgi:hypothetical protein
MLIEDVDTIRKVPVFPSANVKWGHFLFKLRDHRLEPSRRLVIDATRASQENREPGGEAQSGLKMRAENALKRKEGRSGLDMMAEDGRAGQETRSDLKVLANDCFKGKEDRLGLNVMAALRHSSLIPTMSLESRDRDVHLSQPSIWIKSREIDQK